MVNFSKKILSEICFTHFLQFTDRASPMSNHARVLKQTYGRGTGPMAAQMFGNAGREHMEKYGKMFEY